MIKKKSITIAWLYPDLMNTYGDRGNIICLKKRCEWRKIRCEVKELNVGFDLSELKKADFIFMGGAQDRQQKIVSADLFKKAKELKKLIDAGKPGLYICGAYQLLGEYYKEADGTTIKGLGIVDLYTENPGMNTKRFIGNVAIRSSITEEILIGFENHGGRTYLGKSVNPFGKVIAGYGNNGKDKTEGIIYKNIFGSYLHGPILPKNPQFTDYLIRLSLEEKYGTKFKLEPLNDNIENLARVEIARRLKVKV
ncbi:MAG: hypothetical protein A2W22_03990 [Candidatus Levybacteria bacterium RBG_16_35_11]|nr:MAG: hypothetical protein A2W22_03990 [Candidatus Levybacteria bacterium RBG_16_35_11]